MKQMSSLDASYYFMEQAAAGFHFTSVYIYDPATSPTGELKFLDVKHHIEQRLHASPAFRRKVVTVPLNLDYPYWVEDEQFNTEFHLRHIALPKPGDWRQLCIMVARLHSRPLDMTKPLWEMYVIEGLHIEGMPDDAFAIVTKVHLAAIDESGTEISSAIHDISPSVEAIAPPKQWEGEPTPSAVAMLSRTLSNNLFLPIKIAREIISFGLNNLDNVTDAVKMAIGQKEYNPVPLVRFNDRVSQFRVYDSIQFPLAQFSQMRKTASGATVHDLVTAIISGAVREYLSSISELPIKSLHTGSYFHLAGKHGKSKLELIFLPLHSDLKDPIERLSAIVSSTAEQLDKHQTLRVKQIMAINPDLPAPTFAMASRLMIGVQTSDNAFSHSLGGHRANCMITNVPSPDKTLYFNGSKMLYQSALGPLMDGMGLNFMINSYNNSINIGYTSCRELMPDPEHFSECMENAYQQLHKALLGRNNVVSLKQA